MRTLGILGGMSWVSTQDYYRQINQSIQNVCGRQCSAELLIASLDFQPIVDAQAKGEWRKAGEILSRRAQGLEKAGAEAFLIASNTMHLVFGPVASAVGIPGLNIFDAICEGAKSQGLKRLGLLGTRYTMSDEFFVGEYRKRGVEIVVPEVGDAKRVNEIIFRELIHNKVNEESARFYRKVVGTFAKNGVQGVILGCTEIGLLLQPGQCEIPLLDSTALHVQMAVKWLLDPKFLHVHK